MAIIDQKREVFGSIAALNVLTEGYPKLSEFASFASVNNSTNTTEFLVDLLEALEGFQIVKDVLVDTIVYRLPDLEEAIKDGLKLELKEMVSCSVNPSVPDWFKNGQDGVEIEVPNIDFFDIMKLDPTTEEGGFLYTNVPPGKDSSDFNTYLNFKIQDPGSNEPWQDIVETTFFETGTPNLPKNNVIRFTTTTTYDNKTLVDFNNDYIDSLTLFGEPGSVNSTMMINLIIEELFGSISASPKIKKSKKQIKIETEIREILDCIIFSENDVIDDSFFTFDNPTVAKIGAEVERRAKGIMEVKTCGNLETNFSLDTLSEINEAINQTNGNKVEEAAAVNQAFNTMADTQASFTDSTNAPSVKNNFFKEIIMKFVRIVMTILISPKFISLFAINHQILYGQGTNYSDAIDFMKKNRKLMKNISKVLLKILLVVLVKAALYYLSKRFKDKLVGDEIEKGKQYVSIILSYLGVPPDVIATIRKI